MTKDDKKYVVDICRILADKMDDSGKVAVEQVISAVEDLEEQQPCEDAISRDEAIRATTGMMRDVGIGDEIGKEYAEHILSCLPSVTPKHCEDVISRQAAIETIDGWLKCNDYNNAERHIMRAMQSVLYDLPPVTPKQRKGHWVLARTFPTKLYDEYLNEYECSECYRRIRSTESQLVNYPYCHCGSKMKSEEQE